MKYRSHVIFVVAWWCAKTCLLFLSVKSSTKPTKFGSRDRGCENGTKFGRLIDGGLLHISTEIGEWEELAGSPSNTMSPGPRPTSVPSSILIHSAVWHNTLTLQTGSQADRTYNGPRAQGELFYIRSHKNTALWRIIIKFNVFVYSRYDVRFVAAS